MSQTCNLTQHETSEMTVPNDVVIGGDIPYDPDSRFDDFPVDTGNQNSQSGQNNTQTGGNETVPDVDGQEFVIGAY